MFVFLLSFEWGESPTRLLVLLGLLVLAWLVGRLIERATGLGPDTTDLTPPQLLVTGPRVVVHTFLDADAHEQPDASRPSPGPGAIEPDRSDAALGGFHCIAAGSNRFGRCDVPRNELFVSVAAGLCHSIGLRSDGSTIIWGRGHRDKGVPQAPPGERFVQVAAGYDMSAGLRADGSVLAWGRSGRCELDAGNGITKIVMNCRHVVGLRADGTVAGLSMGRSELELPGDIHCRDIAANRLSGLLLRSDGRVVPLGMNDYGQCAVPEGERFRQVAMGFEHAIGLRENGTVIGWGSNTLHQCDAPPGVRFDSIHAGLVSVGMREDGRACSWGPRLGRLDGYRFRELSMSWCHVLGLVEDRVGSDDDAPNLRTGRRLTGRSVAMAFAGDWDAEDPEDWR